MTKDQLHDELWAAIVSAAQKAEAAGLELYVDLRTHGDGFRVESYPAADAPH
jgi:hypothetical protein